MKNKILLISVFSLFLSVALRAQISIDPNAGILKVADVKDRSGWLVFHDNASVDPLRVFDDYSAGFRLGTNDHMELSRTNSDKLGFSHYRFQQKYNGVPVAGAEFIIHGRDGRAETGNGKLVSGLNLNTNPVIDKERAIQAAIGFVGAQKFMWEDPQNETMLKHITGKENATYYPKAELVIFDKSFSGIAANYRLAWKVNVYAEKPLSYRDIYIDASTGSVFHIINRLMTTDVPGIAHTKYSDTVSMMTDSVSPGQYRLREYSRGDGIETYDMNTGTSYGAAVDFIDTDNFWNNINADQDEVATDAHWGAEMTYDYYLNVHGRQSYDDSSSKLVSYVHYDQGYANASWDGIRMTYGDGDGTSEGPFTALDVCGHEITHGVTEYTANLVYQDEPGALNESFSDMFGAAVEFYALNGAGDWFVGEDFDLTGGNGFRNMEDPKSDQQPDTYHGQYWYTGSLDFGGVHTNSGVANYWFYLLSEGGSGVNDNNQSYSVERIGLDTAAQIAYRALSLYLTSNSEYNDARMATLQAAADLYGSCSVPFIQCANAWYAVGVGMAIADYDFSMLDVTAPVTACGLTDEIVSVRALYNGCSVPAIAGDTIRFFYKVDSNAVMEDTLFLLNNVNAGDTLIFTFDSLADVSVIGFHHIQVWLSYSKDTLSYNDTLMNYTFENKIYQNVDVGARGITTPVSSCNLGAAEPVSIKVGFFGCDFLPAGTKVAVGYNVNGGTNVMDTLTLSSDLYPGTLADFTFAQTADLSASGTYLINTWTAFDQDTMTSNDAFNSYKVKKPVLQSDTTVGFEETNTADNYLVHTTFFSHAYIHPNAHNSGYKGFVLTGGNPMQYLSMIEFPTGSNTWEINDFLSAKIDFCVDATAYSEMHLHYDLKQTYGETVYSLYLGAGDWSIASNFRVLVNDTVMIGSTLRPNSGNTDPFTTRFVDLSAYAGTKFTLSFETRNVAKDTLGFTMDNAYIDNVTFSPEDQYSIEEPEKSDFISAYPNPGDGYFWIDYNAEMPANVELEVFDMLGKLILRSGYELLAGLNRLRIDLSGQADGLYELRLTSGNEIHRGRVIIDK